MIFIYLVWMVVICNVCNADVQYSSSLPLQHKSVTQQLQAQHKQPQIKYRSDDGYAVEANYSPAETPYQSEGIYAAPVEDPETQGYSNNQVNKYGITF